MSQLELFSQPKRKPKDKSIILRLETVSEMANFIKLVETKPELKEAYEGFKTALKSNNIKLKVLSNENY
jgi:hypothetical protein